MEFTAGAVEKGRDETLRRKKVQEKVLTRRSES